MSAADFLDISRSVELYSTVKPRQVCADHEKMQCEKKRLLKLEQDEQKIANRVNMLKLEEQKIQKKIGETRARAEKLSQIK